MNCNVCNSSRVVSFSEQKGWKCYRCADCGFLFAAPSDRDAPVADYGESYFQPLSRRDESEEWRTFYEKTLAQIGSLAPGRRLLDAGCGTSTFAGIARQAGWQAFVVDGSPQAIRHQKERLGLEGAVVDLNSASSIEAALRTARPFDAVNSFHVIEHLSRPRDYLSACFESLAPGGVLRLGLPYYPRNRVRAHEAAFRLGLANHPYNFGLPDHVSYFDERGIVALLTMVGFELAVLERTAYTSVLSMAKEAGPGGWARTLVKKAVERFPGVFSRIGLHHHLDIVAVKRG